MENQRGNSKGPLLHGWKDKWENTTVRARRRDPAVIVEVQGRLTLGAPTACLRRVLSALEREGDRLVVLDLSEASRVDSSGLGLIIEAVARCASRDGLLAVVAPSRSYPGKLLVETKLLTAATVCDDEPDAIQQVMRVYWQRSGRPNVGTMAVHCQRSTDCPYY